MCAFYQLLFRLILARYMINVVGSYLERSGVFPTLRSRTDRDFNGGVSMRVIKKLFYFLLLFLAMENAWSEPVTVPAEIVQGPFKTNIFLRGKVWVEKINELHKSLAVVLESTNDKGVVQRRRVDAYDDSGTGPTVESIFFYPVKGKKNIIVLVS